MARGAGPTAIKKKSNGAGGKDCPASDITVYGEENFQGKSETFEERHHCCFYPPFSDIFEEETILRFLLLIL